MIGTTVGGYKIVSKLATGGMGTVYKAEHALIGKVAAIKVLKSELCSNTEIVERFFNEAKATTSIKHPGIVEVFDFGYLESGDAYLTMEFLEGMNLASWLEARGKVSEGEAALVMRSICNALAVAHAKGIIHRDLKPDNIFMIPDPESASGERPKILDFGIAKLTEMGAATSATRTGAVMGTPTYMSPEQCKGAGVVDHRADIYSLGCIFYELVCGRPPFTDMGAGEMIGAHLFIAPPMPREHTPELSDDCETLIMALLDKNPNQRPQTAKELAARLTELAQQHHWVTSGAPNGVTSPSLVPLMRPTPMPMPTPYPRMSSPMALELTRASSPAMGAVSGLLRAESATHGDATQPKPTTLSGAASQSFDVPQRSRKGLAILGAAGALVVGGIVAFALVSSSGSSTTDVKNASGATREKPVTGVTTAPTPTPMPTPTPTPTPTTTDTATGSATTSGATTETTATGSASATGTTTNAGSASTTDTANGATTTTAKVPTKKPPAVKKPPKTVTSPSLTKPDPVKPPKKPTLIETDI